MEKFSKKMRLLGKRLEGNTVYYTRLTTLAVIAELGERTPVDTGEARINWQVGVDRTPTYKIPVNPAKTRPNISNPAGLELKKLRKSTQEVYIVNNAEHIDLLNQGHSSQAPAGFIEAAVIVAKQRMKKSLKHFFNKVPSGN